MVALLSSTLIITLARYLLFGLVHCPIGWEASVGNGVLWSVSLLIRAAASQGRMITFQSKTGY